MKNLITAALAALVVGACAVGDPTSNAYSRSQTGRVDLDALVTVDPSWDARYAQPELVLVDGGLDETRLAEAAPGEYN